MKPYYADDAVTIYHGDCRDVMPTLKGVELVVTSPPYFNARDYSSWSSYGDFLWFLSETVAALSLVVVAGRMVCINSSAIIEARSSRSTRSSRYNLPGDIHRIVTDAGWWFQEEIVWLKPEGAAINRNGRFFLDRHPMQWRANPTTERIAVYQVPTPELNDTIIRRHGGRDRVVGDYPRSDAWAINPVQVAGHPAPFPIEIPSRLINLYSWPNDVVLDPFVGSGTSLLAAKTLGRRAIGIEIEERYCERAALRCSQEVLGLSA